MSIEITAGAGEKRGDGFQSRETLTAATGAISLTTDYTVLAGGTATGFANTGYVLPNGRDGQSKEIILMGTGEITIHMTGTASGALVLNAVDESIDVRYRNGKWRLIGSAGVTTASAT